MKETDTISSKIILSSLFLLYQEIQNKKSRHFSLSKQMISDETRVKLFF